MSGHEHDLLIQHNRIPLSADATLLTRNSTLDIERGQQATTLDPIRNKYHVPLVGSGEKECTSLACRPPYRQVWAKYEGTQSRNGELESGASGVIACRHTESIAGSSTTAALSPLVAYI